MPALGPALDACLSVTPSVGALLSQRSQEDVMDVLHALPDAFVAGGLECRLDEDTRVDVVACARRWQARRLAEAARGSPCGAMLARWLSASADDLASSASAVWLEFDRDAAESALPSSLWARVFPFFRVAEVLGVRPGREQLADLLGALLTGTAAMPCAQTTAQRLLEALPRGSRLLHLAALDHRAQPELRAHIELPDVDRARYLEASSPRAAKFLRDVAGDFPLPLAAQLVSTGGEFNLARVELSAPAVAPLREHWQRVFGRLVERGLASTSKVDAVLDWASPHTYHARTEPAPVHVNRVFHLSLRCDGAPAAKAYLYLYPSYLTSTTETQHALD